MISERAKCGLKTALSRCLEDALRTSAHPSWTMEALSNEQEIGKRQFIMLTVSSYDFRMVVLLHFSRNEASLKYVSETLQLTPETMEQSRFDDYLSEVGNNFCGAYKRELGNYFPYLGMSTPNLLLSDSLPYIKTWPMDYETHLRAHDDDQVEFFGSLYIASSGDLDFIPQEPSSRVEEVETGALEMF